MSLNMHYLRVARKSFPNLLISCRNMCQGLPKQQDDKLFEPVFSLPAIKYITMFSRLKVYHLAATSIALPSCGVLEFANIFPEQTFLAASYIGVSAAALLCLGTLPFRNIIGFLYISQDNQHIKISSVNYWGKRVNRTIPVDDWIPMMDMSPKITDAIFLTPHLADGTKYKLLVRYGKILNAKKIEQVLE